ncbi:hypothetical protein [Stutzerimonas stutzeri]|uniref:hypothetical protein n=1 Tax=Stutzerimonas TaxID=2901164 RepID=UPI001BAF502C|nr:hypothetical protein [Stutzerimonas stutzeri]QUE76002.1 hypothetical protein KCX70_22810 [Stutzerimonas stutzeri]
MQTKHCGPCARAETFCGNGAFTVGMAWVSCGRFKGLSTAAFLLKRSTAFSYAFKAGYQQLSVIRIGGIGYACNRDKSLRFVDNCPSGGYNGCRLKLDSV